MRKHRNFLFVVCCVALTTLAVAKTDKNKAIVTYPSAFAVSQPLSEMPVDLSFFADQEMPEPRPSPLRSHAVVGPWQQDPALQTEVLPNVGATQGVNFDGVGAQNFAPSDSNMAVGPNHILEGVNVRLAVFSKTGTLLSGPTNFTTFFSALGGDCAAGASDPIANYDRLADRWVISDVGLSSRTGPFSECVGVSKTNDPTGAYFLFSFSFGANLNDYPKLGVWPTTSNGAYLATYNIFQNAQTFIGADLCGLDRTKMLAGDPTAAQLCQPTPNSEGSYLPSDIDGPTAPTDGTPGLFLTWQNNNPGQLFLRKLTLNFAANTATLSAATAISVANDNLACPSCVPQLGTAQTLDTLGDRLMYRFPVRHFADHDRATASHAVANGTQVAMRWYELFDPAGAVTLNQQGTFAPDTTFRWMGSMAEDNLGDIALGYSASSTTIHPAIRFTGRVPSDPLGTLETEASIIEGTGSQINFPKPLSRWGDYTALQVDPSDDCTFWYVDQYEKFDGTFNWSTNVGSFAFTDCTADFTVGASPSSLAISQGANGTSTITVTSLGGFNSAVTLDASGLPSGVTAAFAPNPVTPPTNVNITSTLTLTASNTATTGTAPVTITGTSGSLVHTAAITLTVNQGFTISSITNPPNANPGQFTTASMQIATSDGNNFASNVTFALPCSGLPAGATCVNPTQISSGATSPQTLQITVQTTGPFTGPARSGPQHKLRSQKQRLWLPLSLPLASMVLVGLAGRSLPRRYKIVGLFLALALTGLLVACGGGSSSPAPPPPLSVTVSPNPVNTLFPNLNVNGTQAPPQTQLFKATVNNSANQTVTWAVSGGSGTPGSIDQTGLYSAPATLPSPNAPVTVTATSQADTTKSGSATVNIQTPTPPSPPLGYPITVTVTEGPTVHATSFVLTVN